MSSHPGHHIDKCRDHGTVISQCGCLGNGPKPLTEFPCHRKFSCHPDYQKPEPPFPMDVPGSKPPSKRMIDAFGPDTYKESPLAPETPIPDPVPATVKFCHGCHEDVGSVEWHECPMKFKSGLPDGYGVRSLYVRPETED